MSRRAAVITDIHGNVPALDAALRRIEQLDADDLYCGGDLVGYGPWPNEICREIEDRAIPTIYGNYDYAIARDLDDCGCFYPTPKDREIGQASVAWTLQHTDDRSKRFMHELPFDLRFELAGKRVRLVHGSPRKVNEYLSTTGPRARSNESLSSRTATYCFSGTRTSRGSGSTAASSSSIAVQSGSRRTATREEASRS